MNTFVLKNNDAFLKTPPIYSHRTALDHITKITKRFSCHK